MGAPKCFLGDAPRMTDWRYSGSQQAAISAAGPLCKAFWVSVPVVVGCFRSVLVCCQWNIGSRNWILGILARILCFFLVLAEFRKRFFRQLPKLKRQVRFLFPHCVSSGGTSQNRLSNSTGRLQK